MFITGTPLGALSTLTFCCTLLSTSIPAPNIFIFKKNSNNVAVIFFIISCNMFLFSFIYAHFLYIRFCYYISFILIYCYFIFLLFYFFIFIVPTFDYFNILDCIKDIYIRTMDIFQCIFTKYYLQYSINFTIVFYYHYFSSLLSFYLKNLSKCKISNRYMFVCQNKK